jgi:hypothetical protein
MKLAPSHPLLSQQQLLLQVQQQVCPALVSLSAAVELASVSMMPIQPTCSRLHGVQMTAQ